MAIDVRLIDTFEVTEQQDLPAGEFSAWLRNTRQALKTQSGVDVPCGDCNACCRSSYFVHIAPEETTALKRIPRGLLFPAPGKRAGTMLLGYDERGHCPMLVDGSCSIYEDRPLTCRTYDCRVFPAAGIAAGEEDKALIDERVKRWRFAHPDEQDRLEHSAVSTAATFIAENARAFVAGVAGNASQVAVAAIESHDVFLEYHEEYRITGRVPGKEEAIDAVDRSLDTFEVEE